MATIPEEPHTDLEQYLNRLATGEGEYPAEPHTNVEQYLNYMIENGLGGKSEIVTTLPAEGTDGAIYILVDDAEHPTKAYGVYTYAGGRYVLVAQPIDQSVKLVTELPETGEEGVLYYLEIDESGATDTYDLYRWLNNDWIKVDSDIVLYSSTGQNVDGAMTQKAVTDAINGLPVKTLTTADYNWHASGSTDDGVALWLLDAGVYFIPADIKAYLYRTGSGSSGAITNYSSEVTAIVGTPKPWASGQYASVVLIERTNFKRVFFTTNDGISIGHSLQNDFEVATRANFRNNLTGQVAGEALDARQGKVLNERIGDLTTLTTTAKTSAVAAINELAGNGIKTLTSADYNYPTNNPTGVATWLLDEGVYKVGEANLNVNFFNSYPMALPLNQIIIVSKKDTDTVSLRLANGLQYYRSDASGFPLNATPGVDAFTVLLSSQTINNLTSNETRSPLSANQGKVLNDKIGDLATLTTTAKTSAVAAINELDSDKEGKTITGSAAPTTATVADNVGQKYYDSTNDKWYVCKAITPGVDPDPTTYTWVEQAGGPTVVQTTGTSTTDVMSQNAVTDMVFAGNSKQRIRIGDNTAEAGPYGSVAIGTGARGAYYGVTIGYNCGVQSPGSSSTEIGSVVIGTNSYTRGKGMTQVIVGRDAGPNITEQGSNVADFAVSLGAESHGNKKGSVALGACSKTSYNGEVSIGSTVTTYGYNGSNYRLLTGVYDPQSAHDAANKQYVDANSATTLTNSQFNSILENA